ncbi:thiol:disulfide interchange protein DsbA/DsbL [Luteimonas sp. SX5]|uniref:Thiol:disulfide interchange protein n=1 Tax=Luteimonas galliterrae TaxID=2940486 RepID=A0ABT0MMD7_9GAMM|nr:thiol:disulfide interchange protein DsbA/DsbL [Luteimonas galliterrae]MCL1635773.1 thiol:disulfide interchange protein DsbA/DsbL [Luteimonas galliterrae]
MLKRFATWSLLAALLIPALAGAQVLIPGTDYDELAQGQPFEPLNGKVEVVEIFAYGCHFCAQFQPLVDQWKRKLPADVRFTYVPATYSLDDPFARAFYAAQAKPGLFARTHEALFQAINTDITVPRNASIDELAAFYSGYGVTAPAFAAAMQTPAVEAKLRKARDFALAVELQGTPSLIVNGKYRVKGASYQDMLRIADQLIAKERSARR